ncbi:MAG: DUF4198 domain-containing protein [Desulfobacterales bacterium]|nr:DUF4198 domain-containing protein [Desulfobacterales bacterium]
MKRLLFVSSLVLAILLCASSLQAHMLWLNASDYTPRLGETVSIEIGWGHAFPREQFISEGRLEQVFALDATGQKTELRMIFPSFYQFTPKAEGAYRIVAVLKSGFLSITSDGHARGNRKDLSNVVTCFQYMMDAEAWIRVGDKKSAFSGKEQAPLKLLAMNDPVSLKAGQSLPLKVMFQGKPLAGVKVTGTFAGRKAGKDDHWAVEEETGPDGIANVKLDSPGQWLFRVAHKTPYPDKTEADDYSYRTSLTFGVM